MKFFGYLDDWINKAYYHIKYWWDYSVLKKPKPSAEEVLINSVKVMAIVGLAYGLSQSIFEEVDNITKKTSEKVENERKE